MSHPAPSRAGCASLTLGFIVASAAAAGPRYRAIILLPLAGQPSAFPTAMSEEGEIAGVAGVDRFDPIVIPVIADSAALNPLPTFPETSQNFPLGLNAAGLIVGVSNFQAFAWDGDGPGPLPSGGPPGFAYNTNEAGQIVGSELNDLLGIEYPMHWASVTDFPTPLAGLTDPVQGAAFAINEAGQIAGAVRSPDGFVATRWNHAAAAPTAIGGLAGASLSEFLDINTTGDLCGRSSFPDFSTAAMLYTESDGQLLGLGTLGGNYSFAHALNDARDVVGDSNNGVTGHAFLWRSGTLHDLNDLVASADAPYEALVSAVDINNAGVIAAEALLASGDHRIARLIPIAAGDVNCDGAIDFFDIDAFLLSLFDPAAYALAFPNCDALYADMNNDALVNFFDIDPFVACIFGSCP